MKNTPSKTQFLVRPHVYPGHYQFVAITPQGRCYQLGFTAPMEPTLECAIQQWKEARRDWEPDNSGGAGATLLPEDDPSTVKAEHKRKLVRRLFQPIMDATQILAETARERDTLRVQRDELLEACKGALEYLVSPPFIALHGDMPAKLMRTSIAKAEKEAQS